MPHMRLAGYAPGPGLASLPVWAFYLHPVPLAFAPGTLADLIRTGLRTVALIGLPQIDAFTRSAAVQGGGILTCHQMKIEQEHDVPNRAFDAAKMAVGLTMARVGIRRVKAERQRPVLARYRTRHGGPAPGQFFAQLVLQRLEFRHRNSMGSVSGQRCRPPGARLLCRGKSRSASPCWIMARSPARMVVRSALAKLTSHCRRCLGVLMGLDMRLME